MDEKGFHLGRGEENKREIEEDKRNQLRTKELKAKPKLITEEQAGMKREERVKEKERKEKERKEKERKEKERKEKEKAAKAT
ncbi:hypothetical protein PTT_11053 [Pyrenophora teres f. teres 0-1]|uniref:Uncharacterized protein n=1 Tax=Pyrenophora teres f. teres (strain 0-1) TaxID=861557 RepID=E3RQN6_PYRTT|nr:hypothetical protein PTT_11053 [Pyrenophora teres f. teres 0-1]